MAKVNKDYFSHDFHARSDLRSICMRFGMEGYGFYWGFVEILHESGGYIKESDLAAIAFDLRVPQELCDWIVRESGFFTVKKGKVTADRVVRNLKKRAEISEARREAVNKRWKTDGEGENLRSEGEEPLPSPLLDLPPETLTDDEESSSRTYYRLMTEEEATYWEKWFDDKLEKIEENPTKDDLFGKGKSMWSVRPLIMNLLDELKRMRCVTVNRRKVSTTKFFETISYYFHSRARIDEFCTIVNEVEEKVKSGRVKNKQNYLISALYSAAKMNGGGQ